MHRRLRREPSKHILPGWDDERVQRLIQQYDAQTDEEDLAEDEAAFADPSLTVTTIPIGLVPAVGARLAVRID